MKYLSQLKNIIELDEMKGIYHEMMNQMDAEATYFADNFDDDPVKMSEWGHNYFCEEDGGRLTFSLEKPHSHFCQICGKEYKGEMYDNVWVYFYRNAAIISLLKSALLYKVRGDLRYLDYIKKILSFYADNYKEFILHAKGKVVDNLTIDVGGAGKIMPQGLNEAIILVRIVNVLEIIKEDLDKEFLEKINDKLFIPASEILIPQLVKIHNIPCWINSALGLIGLFTKNEKLLDLVFNGDFGIRNQLKKGVTKDGFWYEGSIHYNFFLLEGVTNLLLFTKLYDYGFGEEEKIIEGMFESAYYYAFDNDVLPNPNDGWPNLNLKTYSYIYNIAAKIFGQHSKIGNILKNIERNNIERGKIPLSRPYYYKNEISFEKLAFNPALDIGNYLPFNRKSKNFKESFYGILRSENINIFYKYGHCGPSHAHPDKMNIEVMVNDYMLSRDLSNAGYGSKLCNEWHRMSTSHNTVVVDGKNHVSMEGGKVLDFNDYRLHAYAENVYDGVDFIRKIDLLKDGFKDEFLVNSNSKHVYDWLFHSEAKLITKLKYESCKLGFKENGYQHIQDVKRVSADDDTLRLEWDLNGMVLESEIGLENSELFIAKTYDNPVSSFRTTIILRQKDYNARFSMTWKIK